MNKPLEAGEPSPVGRRVIAYHVLGEERDGEGQWVGADMLVDVYPAGRFFLNIVTKQHFANERIDRVFSDAEHPEDLLIEDESESKTPFVLNDVEITDNILEQKFTDRVVAEDLAVSMWYEGPLRDSPED